MSAQDREKIFTDYETAIEEENSAAANLATATTRMNTAKDAAQVALAALNGMIAESSAAALAGTLDPAPPTPDSAAPASSTLFTGSKSA